AVEFVSNRHALAQRQIYEFPRCCFPLRREPLPVIEGTADWIAQDPVDFSFPSRCEFVGNAEPALGPRIGDSAFCPPGGGLPLLLRRVSRLVLAGPVGISAAGFDLPADVGGDERRTTSGLRLVGRSERPRNLP